MLPGNAIDGRVNRKRDWPPCGLIGWPAAWTKLERVEHPGQRDFLSKLVREAGFQGPTALSYAASMAMWRAGIRDHPGSTPARLDHDVASAIDRRVAEMLSEAPAGLFPKLRARG